MANEYAQVHRFGNQIAIYIGTGETVYLTPDQAQDLGGALTACADDIGKKSFQDSDFKTFRLTEV